MLHDSTQVKEVLGGFRKPCALDFVAPHLVVVVLGISVATRGLVEVRREDGKLEGRGVAVVKYQEWRAAAGEVRMGEEGERERTGGRRRLR